MSENTSRPTAPQTPTPAAASAAKPAQAQKPTQAQISSEIEALAQRATEGRRAGALPEVHARRDYPPYRSSILRHPTHELVRAFPEDIELVSPVFGHVDVSPLEADLTIQHTGEPIGERISVSGRVLDGEGRPVRHQLIEIWQANAAGRYIQREEQHPAPLDPNFSGVGRCLTGEDGSYRFVTVKPGPYPWHNHTNAWRPAHIHFSLFGDAFTQRMVTQMYFPGDPLFPLDPIFQAVTDPAARQRLIATYDHEETVPDYSMGYRWDIVLTGSHATWMNED